MKSKIKKFFSVKVFNFLFLNVILFISLFGNMKNVEADTLLKVNFPKEAIVEHLRLDVPKEIKEAWLNSEKKSWEPWLLKQDGFLGRQLLWDPKTEEGTLLIGWKSRSAWKSIPQAEIELVQKNFERIARLETGEETGNPFPMVFEGELNPQ